MSDKKAKITFENKSFDLPIVEGSMGHSAIDARKLNQHQLLSSHLATISLNAVSRPDWVGAETFPGSG